VKNETGPRQQLRDKGFTLIETLVALAIVAAMTTALIDTIARDARIRLAVKHRREALMVAQSALDQMEDANAASNGQWREYVWRVSREPFGLADALDRHPLEQLVVVVSNASDKGREITRLSTVRLKP
jgi:prepilin-type N-terminal cleavage/methylation domain-containing protein